MTQVSMPNDRFLTKEFVIPTVFEIMNPYLAFFDFLPKVKADSRAVKYKTETTSQSGDPKKKTPRTRTPGSKFTYLDISQFTMQTALLDNRGFAIRIDEDAVQYAEGVDEINRAYSRVAYWLGEYLNTEIATTLDAGATASSVTPTKVWSDMTDGKHVRDLIAMAEAMDREGYPYQQTDVFVEKTNFYELQQFLVNVTAGDLKQREILGMPVITKDMMTIPAAQCNIRKLKSGLTHGTALSMDGRNPAATIYYNNNPQYAPQQVTYQTIIDFKPVTQTIDNFGFSFNSYKDDETHDTVMQFWVDFRAVVKEPYAVLKTTGL